MPNKLYVSPETTIVFQDSGGSANLTLSNLGFGAGRISAQYDRGAGSKPARYRWRAVFQFGTAPQIGELCEIYLAQSRSGSVIDGNVGASDATLSSDKRRNLDLIGVVVHDTTSTNTDIVGSGICYIYDRYIQIGVWNASSGDNLRNSSNTSYVELTPLPDEVQ